MSNDYIERLALIMASNCVRNTIIEEYHGRGSLSQEDMKAFNKEVVNKLYTFLRILINGSEEHKDALFKITSLFYPIDWDKPIIDSDLIDGIKKYLNNPDSLNCLFETQDE